MTQLTEQDRHRIRKGRPEAQDPSDRIAVWEMNSPLHFVGAFMREPFKVGAVWPSSSALSRVVANCCEIKPGDLVVELGPGNGAFTGQLLKRLDGQGQLVAMEIDSTHATILRHRFPRCTVIHDSAENLTRHLNGRQADCIVSGLAWGNMLPQTQDRIFNAILDSLTPNGQLVAFAYAHAAWFPTSQRFRRRLRKHFKHVKTTPVVWRNLPPAFVFSCRRA
jgi:phospholipid N-methyltransferase